MRRYDIRFGKLFSDTIGCESHDHRQGLIERKNSLGGEIGVCVGGGGGGFVPSIEVLSLDRLNSKLNSGFLFFEGRLCFGCGDPRVSRPPVSIPDHMSMP